MKEFFAYFPDSEVSWAKFLDFDARIAATVREEARSAGISFLSRTQADDVSVFAERVADALKLA